MSSNQSGEGDINYLPRRSIDLGFTRLLDSASQLLVTHIGAAARLVLGERLRLYDPVTVGAVLVTFHELKEVMSRPNSVLGQGKVSDARRAVLTQRPESRQRTTRIWAPPLTLALGGLSIHESSPAAGSAASKAGAPPRLPKLELELKDAKPYGLAAERRMLARVMEKIEEAEVRLEPRDAVLRIGEVTPLLVDGQPDVSHDNQLLADFSAVLSEHSVTLLPVARTNTGFPGQSR